MMDFQTIQKKPSIPQVVLEKIKGMIAEGKIRPGDLLPSEAELAEKFGVGRSSIREAMRALHLIGVVEVIQGKGTFMREPGILPLMVDWARVTKTGVVDEVMEARQFMEVILAQLAAQRAADQDIESLKVALKHSQESVGDIETNVEAGVDFHLRLADAAHNQVLALMYRTIRDLYLETARRTRITPEVAQDRIHDHEHLLAAITAHDPETAARVMKDHIDKAYQFLSIPESETKISEKKG